MTIQPQKLRCLHGWESIVLVSSFLLAVMSCCSICVNFPAINNPSPHLESGSIGRLYFLRSFRHKEFKANVQYDKSESKIPGQSSSPVCGFWPMEQVRLCAVWPGENWLGSSMDHLQGWRTVLGSYSHSCCIVRLVQRLIVIPRYELEYCVFHPVGVDVYYGIC